MSATKGRGVWPVKPETLAAYAALLDEASMRVVPPVAFTPTGIERNERVLDALAVIGGVAERLRQSAAAGGICYPFAANS